MGYPMQSVWVPCGTARLTEPHVYDSHTEYAAWYYAVECPPQEAPMTTNGYYVTFSLSGIVVGSDLRARFAGVPVGSRDPIHDIMGKESSVSFHWYNYTIPDGESTHGPLVLSMRALVPPDPDTRRAPHGRCQALVRRGDGRYGECHLPFPAEWGDCAGRETHVSNADD